jgi:hypothetical protein
VFSNALSYIQSIDISIIIIAPTALPLQLCAALNVKMVVHVQTLTHVNVFLVGVEIIVKHVKKNLT